MAVEAAGPRFLLTAMLALAAMLAMSIPAGASGPAQRDAASGNLVVNPRGMVGAVSAQGWDEVTIPGWQVSASTRHAYPPITVGDYPVALAITS